MKNIKFTLFLAVILLFVSSSLEAQKKRRTSKDEEKVTRSKVIIFGDDDNGEEDDIRNLNIIIKTNPSSFIFGSQFIEMEKEMSDHLSLQAGLGVTFKDYTKSQSIFSEIFDEDIYNQESINFDYTSNIYDEYYDDSRKSYLGYFFSFSPRLYFAGDGYEGSYIAASFTFKRNNFKALDVVEGIREIVRTTSYTDKEYESFKDITIRYGYSVLYDKLTYESFMGLGIRFKDLERQDLGYSSSNRVSKATQNSKSNGLRFEIGIRIGFQL